MSVPVWIDKAKNRIYIRFEGFMEIERAWAIHDAYKRAIAQMKPGFSVLNFADGYKPSSPEVQDVITSMVKLAEEGGCSRVARVSGTSPLGAMQINRLAHADSSYESRHFKTEAEAKAFLDERDA